ncbi:peptide ABC transporter substrate-binding protein [Lactobacillus sp. CC-MHH1034]|uniref:peptide ABC transporter substrate-binding protein n=1 Tax=Agrilactobacillus fermenti TaxID=2586909 RepID=UPI001E587027|nr:peptide ABC transporter substrate-binding protein [Agrilactobacillus fermenti]MCD2255602.1 peptide ABC transporter substrate-binding protein [Agrilactobacillus fermenti]
MKQQRRFTLLLATLLVGFIIGPILFHGTSQAAAKQVLHLSATAPLDTIDISKATGYGQTGNVYESFYRLGKHGSITPGLAKDTKVSADGLTWTFTLRDAKWSNGDPITAQDFVYSWQRTVNPKTKSQYSYLFEGIKNAQAISAGKLKPEQLGIKAQDDKTVVVTLEKPIAYFKILMAYPLFAPQNEKVAQKYGKKYATKSQNTVYSGPFKIENWNGTSNKWRFVKNDQYWDKSAVKLQQINYEVVPSTSTSLDLFQDGKLDLTPLAPEQVRELKHDKDFKNYPYAMIYYLKYNFHNTNKQKQKALNNQNIRLAISLAINRNQLTQKALGDGSLIPNGFVPKGLAKDPQNKKDFAAEQGVPDTVTYNKTKAKALWQQGLQETGLKKLSLTLIASNDDASSKTVTEYLKDQLEKKLPGLTLNIRQMPSTAANQFQQKGQFDISLSAWGADFNDPITFLQIPESDTSYNMGKYSNKDYDALIHKAQNEDANDPNARWQDLIQASQLFSKDQGMTPLYQNNASYLQNAKVKGIIHNTAGAQWSYKYASIK